MKTIRAREGEAIDEAVRRATGSERDGITEAVIDLNPGLAALGPRLPGGTPIIVPDPPEPEPRALIRLWS